jgi:hypothetical protein
MEVDGTRLRKDHRFGVTDRIEIVRLIDEPFSPFTEKKLSLFIFFPPLLPFFHAGSLFIDYWILHLLS